MQNTKLEAGGSVYVVIKSGVTPFKAYVTSKVDTILVLRLTDEFSIYNLLEKDSITLNYETQDLLESIACEIQAIDIQKNLIELKVNQVSSFENKRSSQREPSSFYINIIRMDSGQEIVANVRNISLGGMTVFSKANLPINQKIKVYAAIKEKKIDFVGIVKWKTALENYYEYGISNIF